jgi:hypothetical protein
MAVPNKKPPANPDGASRSTPATAREAGTGGTPCDFCIQDHHTAYRKHDPHLTARLCEKHHREIHELLLRADVSPLFERNGVKRVALALRAAAVYDRARADAMERWADLLERTFNKRNQ